MDVFNRFSSYFDAAVKNMQKMSADQTQKCQTHYKREFQNIGKVFQQMGQAIQQDGLLRESLTVYCWNELKQNVIVWVRLTSKTSEKQVNSF